MMQNQKFKKRIRISGKAYDFYDIIALADRKNVDIQNIPFSIRILIENLLRKLDHRVVRDEDLNHIIGWQPRYAKPVEIPYHPARVLMQDFTGVPAVVDLAAMRDAVKDLGRDPKRINPVVPVQLVVDHSVQVDYFGTPDALTQNVAKEYERNAERYALLKWAQKSFDNFRVVPPNSGICHQVNLEYLASVVVTDESGPTPVVYPDTLVGTDSHTTMINGIGVMGWGVGGIEAEAVMLGQPYYMSIPEVIGVKLVGRLREDVTATDLVLTITEMLRKRNVVEKFVEYFGPGLKNLTVADRATISNMSPEYGATLGFFPVDEKTIAYFQATGRAAQADIIEACTKAMGLFYTADKDPHYTDVITLDLSTIKLSLAGPARPQDRIPLKDCKSNFTSILGCEYKRATDPTQLSQFNHESGCQTVAPPTCEPLEKRLYDVNINGTPTRIGDGHVVIAAITSCTNTSNPHVMLGAGLVAQKAVARGLTIPPYVKTSLAPGSKVVIRYLKAAGLLTYFEKLGFHTVGFGCTTCIGNSGPLYPELEQVISENDLTVAAVLSGNRNFEARIHQAVRANFLASPMLVVMFAIAGQMDIDFSSEPVARDTNGKPVFFGELWPTWQEIEDLATRHVKSIFYESEYGKIFDGDSFWEKLPVSQSTTFDWDKASTYIKKPPYFDDFRLEKSKPSDIRNAKALLLLGDSVTTDHISPAGAIAEHYPAGQYLKANKVEPLNFNSYGSRRGNHEVMMRGTFGNIRLKNRLVGTKEGSFTIKFPEQKEMFVYEAAMAYLNENRPLIVLGGKEYGTGSSRDWAAKGTALFGVRAIMAVSFERIHRSNLVGMGVLPLMYSTGQSAETLGLDGSETFFIEGIQNIEPRRLLRVKAVKNDQTEIEFEVITRLDTEVEVEYFENGGILPYVLRKMLRT